MHKMRRSILLAGFIPVAFEVAMVYLPFGYSAATFLPFSFPRGLPATFLVSHALYQSVLQAALGSAAALAVGYPVGIILGLVGFRGSSFYKALVFLPFMLPSVVAVVGFTQAYGLRGPFSVFSNGLSGITAINAFYNAPLVALIVSSSLERVNPELVLAAKGLGVGGTTSILRVLLPFTKGGATVGALLSFTYSFLGFLVPLAIGGPSHYTMEVLIYLFLKLGEAPYAILLAMLQLFPLFGVTLIMLYLRGYSVSLGKLSSRVQLYTLKGWRSAAVCLVLALFLGYELYPLFSILRYSLFSPHLLGGFTLLLQASSQGRLQASLSRVVANSLVFSLLSTGITFGLSVSASHYVMIRGGTRWFYELTLILPLMFSPVTLGVALFLTYYGVAGSSLVWLVIVSAQSSVALPVSMRFLLEGLKRTPRELMFAARSLGAAPAEALFRVELPVNSQAISSAAVMAYAVSLGEFAATNIVYIPKFTTVPIAVYSLLEIRDLGAADALSLILVFLALIGYYLVFRTGSAH